MGLPDDVKGFFKDRFSRFDAIPACDGQPASQPATSHVAVASTRYAHLRRAVKTSGKNRQKVDIETENK